jgi:hypothetical protein
VVERRSPLGGAEPGVGGLVRVRVGVELLERRADGDGYLVVANYGAAATLARRTDPRASSR